jgi:hypothetical protein
LIAALSISGPVVPAATTGGVGLAEVGCANADPAPNANAAAMAANDA